MSDSTLGEEHVVAAAVCIFVNGKIYCGSCHAMALAAAEESGEIIRDSSNEIDLNLFNADLFYTNLGRILDRTKSMQEFKVGDSFDIKTSKVA